MATVTGIDIARGQWVLVKLTWAPDSPDRFSVEGTTADYGKLEMARDWAMSIIDVPIGLVSDEEAAVSDKGKTGDRPVDRGARRWCRSPSSVFPAPTSGQLQSGMIEHERAAEAETSTAKKRKLAAVIRRKVNQLIGRAGFTQQDREPLEQELFARVLQSLPRFNPEVAHRNKFITAVVERYVANILRNKKAEKRDHRRITSLNVMIEITDEGPTELAQTIGDRELDARLGRQRMREDELIQLGIDLADVTATLPKHWRALLEMRRSLNMAEISRAMGVPRTTLNAWMQHIRRRFEKAGLRDYLK